MKSKKYYVNIGVEIYISTFMKILLEKNIATKEEIAEAFARSLKEYHDGKFTSIEIKEE